MTQDATSSSSTRLPSYLHGGVLGVVVVVLALQLVSAPRSSLPTIAEIAPQAVQQITEPPPEQATDLGKDADENSPDGQDVDGQGTGSTGEGGGAGGDDQFDPEDPEDPGDDSDDGDEPDGGGHDTDPRQFRCVGNPPRQTEDPQSPKCVPFWKGGDNGGATAPGVTGDEINVVVPGANPFLVQAMEGHFNERYNFYGRRLNLIDTSSERQPAFEGGDVIEIQRQAAVNARTVHDAFASSDFWAGGGVYYMQQVAKESGAGHPVIGVSYQSIIDEKDLARHHPYLWQYPMATDAQLAGLGEWVAKQVCGGVAALSSDLAFQALERTFAVVVYDDPRPKEFGDNGRTSVAPLVNELAGCGVTTDDVHRLGHNAGDDAVEAIVLDLKASGVTSVLCVCDSQILADSFWNTATSSAYFPEWILPSHTENEHVWIKRGAGNDAHARATFGLEFHPAFTVIQHDPWFWAADEGAPGFGWDLPTNVNSYSRQAFYHPLYRSLLVIASGIQLAGPDLTPENFARGLQATDAFPNPEVGIRAGRVGFVGDHSMTDDAAAYWWSSSEIGPFGPASGVGVPGSGPGTACFLDGARRQKLGTWPSAPAPLREGPCFTGETLRYDGT